jgi:hypothetical protein
MFSRDAKHISGENELAAHVTDAATYHRGADHGRLGESDERIHKDREAGRADSCGDILRLAGQISGISVLSAFTPLIRKKDFALLLIYY